MEASVGDLNTIGGLDVICQACKACNGTGCAALVKQAGHKYELPDEFPQNYFGLRFSADAMDCSIPIAMDSHSGCSYSCLYCFSNNLQRAPDRNTKLLQKIVKQGNFYSEWPVRSLHKFLDRTMNNQRSKAMYPLLDRGVPVQLGALGDPFDDLEEVSGWAKKAVPLFIRYGVPVRVGTKGGRLLSRPDYIRLFEDSPDQFWFAFSITCNDDERISKIDINAPVTSERLKAMKLLTEIGCNASLRFRPFLPGVSDSYPGEPEAWKTLIYRARECGARAVSFEYVFLARHLTPRQKAMYRLLFRQMGDPKFGDRWKAMSYGRESCMRGDRSYKYDMTMKIREYTHSLGMTFACSDPAFKEFNDTGSCCGFPETGDKWFSKWNRRQLTEVVVQAKRHYDQGKPRLFSYLDWAPEWAHQVLSDSLINIKNWHRLRVYKHQTFGDRFRNRWNNPFHPRSPYIYFGGVLRPVAKDKNTGDLIYEYNPWKQRFDGERGSRTFVPADILSRPGQVKGRRNVLDFGADAS